MKLTSAMLLRFAVNVAIALCFLMLQGSAPAPDKDKDKKSTEMAVPPNQIELVADHLKERLDLDHDQVAKVRDMLTDAQTDIQQYRNAYEDKRFGRSELRKRIGARIDKLAGDIRSTLNTEGQRAKFYDTRYLFRKDVRTELANGIDRRMVKHETKKA